MQKRFYIVSKKQQNALNINFLVNFLKLIDPLQAYVLFEMKIFLEFTGVIIRDSICNNPLNSVFTARRRGY